jgi:DNA polymerase-3 subunit epsilon
MRQIVLDTETTGLSVEHGHRIIEIGCIELYERRRTGRQFHYYLNPEREIDQGALQVHGLTESFLSDKPKFAQVADELLAFIQDGELVIHNAVFDLAFLNAEFSLLGRGENVLAKSQVLDTLLLARERFPGQKNNLDALCKRLSVDHAHRQFHGALLDADLLCDVYLELTAGQGALAFSVQKTEQPERLNRDVFMPKEILIRVVKASQDELVEHENRLKQIDKASRGKCLWYQLDSSR